MCWQDSVEVALSRELLIHRGKNDDLWLEFHPIPAETGFASAVWKDKGQLELDRLDCGAIVPGSGADHLRSLGGGFKGLQHGQHHQAPEKNTPLANLWTSMLKDAGCKVDKFADANGLANSIWANSKISQNMTKPSRTIKKTEKRITI